MGPRETLEASLTCSAQNAPRAQAERGRKEPALFCLAEFHHFDNQVAGNVLRMNARAGGKTWWGSRRRCLRRAGARPPNLQKGVGENPDSPRAPALPWHALDRPAPMRYLRAQVPGTCRLQTQVTVKPGTRRHLTLEAFRAVGNAGPHPS